MKLLDRLRAHLGERHRLANDKDGQPADLELQAAAAVLLIEAAYGDTRYVWSEHEAIVGGLERAYGIGRKEAMRLLDRADQIRPPAVALKDVTDVILERYNEEQRQEVVRLLWRVIEADRVVDDWEELFANHVAGAVGLSVEGANEARERARRP